MVVYRYIGSAVTDSKGIAHLDYTGSGAGELDIIASSTNPISASSILSDVYEIDDCYFIETGSATTGYSIQNGSLTITNGIFTFTKGSGTSASAFYTNFPKTNYPITDFQGMTMNVKADVISISASNLRMSLFYNNGVWSTAVIHDLSTVGTMEQSIDIPSDATQVRIRFDLTGNENDSVILKDLRILWG